jgi:hypothetical protein
VQSSPRPSTTRRLSKGKEPLPWREPHDPTLHVLARTQSTLIGAYRRVARVPFDHRWNYSADGQARASPAWSPARLFRQKKPKLDPSGVAPGRQMRLVAPPWAPGKQNCRAARRAPRLSAILVVRALESWATELAFTFSASRRAARRLPMRGPVTPYFARDVSKQWGVVAHKRLAHAEVVLWRVLDRRAHNENSFRGAGLSCGLRLRSCV